MNSLIALQNKLCHCATNQNFEFIKESQIFQFNYSSLFAYFCIVGIWTLKREFC